MSSNFVLQTSWFVWQRDPVARRAGFEFETFLVEFMYSKDATSALLRWASFYGLRREDVDDARHFWFERLLKTSQRGTLADWVDDEESARRYSLRALRNTVIDMVKGTRENAAGTGVGDALAQLPDDDAGADPESAFELQLEQSGCESVRQVITLRLQKETIHCHGCRPVVVAALALYVVNSACANDDATSDVDNFADALRGGSDPFDRLLYEALSQVAPDRVQLDDAGRMKSASRKFKSRCDPCVRDLIADAIDRSRGGEAA
jgi:hypothetical protein